MALSADLLRGYTDTIILNQLREADSYGYEITKRISELSQGTLELKEATLYTAFRRMENSGYIVSYWGNEGSGTLGGFVVLKEEDVANIYRLML